MKTLSFLKIAIERDTPYTAFAIINTASGGFGCLLSEDEDYTPLHYSTSMLKALKSAEGRNVACIWSDHKDGLDLIQTLVSKGFAADAVLSVESDDKLIRNFVCYEME